MIKKSLTENFIFWAFVLIVVWAGVPVLAKFGSGQLNGFEMTFWINLFALPVVAIWILPKQQRLTLKSYNSTTVFQLVAIGFLGNLFYQILYFGSYRTITALTGSVLTRFGNIFFVIASMLFLREKHSKANIIAVIFATAGAILSAAKPGARIEFSLTFGFWLIIVATVLNTAYNVAVNATKKIYSDMRVNLFIFKAGTLSIIFVWAMLTATNLFHVSSSWRINLHPPLSDLFTPFFIGAFADGVGFLAWLKMLELGDSVKATIVSALVAVAQVFLSVLFFREDATWVNAILAPLLVIIPTAWVGLVGAKVKKANDTKSEIVS